MLDLLIPMLLAAVAVAALARRQDLYAALLEGGLDGLRLLVSIVPALVMLLTAVHLLRASGAVDLLTIRLRPSKGRSVWMPISSSRVGITSLSWQKSP